MNNTKYDIEKIIVLYIIKYYNVNDNIVYSLLNIN